MIGGEFEELFQFSTNGGGAIKYCCFMDLNFIVACKTLMTFKVAEKDFDRFSEEKVKEFAVPSEVI